MSKGAGATTRSRLASEASLTMWQLSALALNVLLDRALPWLRKKLLSEAPQVGLPDEHRERAELSELLPR